MIYFWVKNNNQSIASLAIIITMAKYEMPRLPTASYILYLYAGGQAGRARELASSGTPYVTEPVAEGSAMNRRVVTRHATPLPGPVNSQKEEI